MTCADQNQRFYRNLGEALHGVYQGSQADIEQFLGESLRVHEIEFVANDGLFVAGRNAMLALDPAIRSMPGAPEWVDANPLRNQFLFNLAIARMHCGVQLDDQYNLQLHAQDVDLAWRDGRVEARWRGRPVRVLHFNSRGRSKYLEWKRFLILQPDFVIFMADGLAAGSGWFWRGAGAAAGRSTIAAGVGYL